MKTTIIPQIHSIDAKEGRLKLSDFYLSDGVLANFKNAAEIFRDNTLGDRYPITYIVSPMGEEEYRIIARSDRIEISASNQKGLMYGLFTLSELDLLNDGELREFDVFDKPSLSLRAMSDDISRGQISTTQNFCDIIKRLARYKYNTYMPYIEDVFKVESVPAWGRYSDPVSAEEWKMLIEYAKGWNITIRPILNLLGHFDKQSNIAEMQEIALKRRDGSVTDVIDPKNPKAREVLLKVLREVVDCFGPGVMHCGGDEPLALTEIFGKDEGARLFIEHYTWLAEEVQKLGCTLMMYADFFAPPWGDYAVPFDRALELPRDVQFVFWDYATRPEYPFVDKLHEAGFPMYISPGSWTWKRFSCDVKICYSNTKGLLKADHGRSLGMIMSSWADGGDTLRELIWPGVLIGANFCWSPESDYSYEDCYNLYHKTFFGFDEEQAALLDPIYHHDTIIRRADESEYRNEFWVDPFEPVRFKDWENIGILQAALRKAAVDLGSLVPARNIHAFQALRLTVARAAFTADKIANLPHGRLKNLEESIPYAEKALALAGDLLVVKELHRKLWFDTNRGSEWELCALRYDDLYDRLRMFARNCRNRKMFNIHV